MKIIIAPVLTIKLYMIKLRAYDLFDILTRRQ